MGPLKNECSFLVYSFMTLTTEEEETLPWEIRLKIAIETAQCLAFLHSVNNRALSREFGMHDIFLDEVMTLCYNQTMSYIRSWKRS